jgi:integrase
MTRYINKADAVGGLPDIHPHQLRHTLATQLDEPRGDRRRQRISRLMLVRKLRCDEEDDPGHNYPVMIFFI